MEVKFKKLTETARAPFQKYISDACWDLYCNGEGEFDGKNYTYKTGIAMEIPEGYVGLIFPRSSNSKQDLLLSNSVGVIDSHYRGEIMVKYKPLKKAPLDIYSSEDRVAQIMIIPRPEIEFIEVDELSDTDRGEGGFGSTGK